MSSTMRVVLGIGVVAIAVVLLVVLKDDGEEGAVGGGTSTTSPVDTTTGPPHSTSRAQQVTVPTIAVDGNGKPVGGVAELSVDEGEQVRFRVMSAVSDEIHLHGYDISEEVEAGGSVGFRFAATIEGLFEAELEQRGEPILELRVDP